MLQIPKHEAIKFIRSQIPTDVLVSKKLTKEIHVVEGLVIPQEVNRISLGMRYLLHVPFDKQVVTQAWEEFENSIRWQWHLKDEKRNELYDPDYDLNKESEIFPGKVARHIEASLVEGKLVLGCRSCSTAS